MADKFCCVASCGKPTRNRDKYCPMHRRRLSVWGDLDADHKRSRNYEWLQSHAADSSDECLVWPFRLNSYGYPLMSRNGNQLLACRVMCELAHGPAPTELHHAAHSCGNRRCVNRRHLRWATPQENIADREAHGTTAKGERGGTAKLTNAEALECKQRLASGESCAAIARKFGVTKDAVHKIKSGKNWGWLHA